MGLIRLFLAVSVMLWHGKQANLGSVALLDGGLAVLAFFIISGFFMSMVLHEKYRHLNHGMIRFLSNRFLRIFPIFFVAMIVQQIYFSIRGIPSVFTSSMDLPLGVRAALIFMNIFKVGQDWWQAIVEFAQMAHKLGGTDPIYVWLTNVTGRTGFTQADGYLLVGQGWSLASELTFYILAPLFVFRNSRFIFILLALSLAVRFWLATHFGEPFAGSLRTKFFPGIFVFFILGHISYLIYRRLEGIKLTDLTGWLAVVSFLVTLVWGIWTGALAGGAGYDHPFTWFFYLHLVVTIPFLFQLTKNLKFDSFLGEYSYPVYLIHGVVIASVDAWVKNWSGSYILITAIISWLLIVFIERPVNVIRARIAAGDLVANNNLGQTRRVFSLRRSGAADLRP